ncbi:MAG: DNA-directed RNA polymerase subunit beta [Eubacteriales bacterium]
MVKPQILGKNTRMSYSKINEALEMPNLIEVQKKSYRWFIEQGLREVLSDVSPIFDYSGNLSIEFVDYKIEETPKYPVEECKDRDVNYAAPLKVKVRLENKLNGEMKESEIFMGDFPLMTDNGTFIINGAERVIVSQIVRSPGIYYTSEIDKSDKKLFAATVIPYRGAWLEYETDANDVFYVRIDKNRKLPITVLLRSLGLGSAAEIRELFGDDEKILSTLNKDTMEAEAERAGTTAREEALKEIYKKLRPGDPPLVESAEILVNNLFFDAKRYDLSAVGRYKFNKKLAMARRISGHTLARPVISPLTGELLAEAGQSVSRALSEKIEDNGVNEVYIKIEDREIKVFSNDMIRIENAVDFDVSSLGINEKVRFTVLKDILDNFTEEKDIINQLRLRRNELIPKHIIKADIFASINYIICLSYDIGTTDDIDHLGNRRLRSVGELLQNQLRIGFSRMDKIVKERMTVQDVDTLTPQTLINIRPVVSAIKEFFGSSPLSQFMDQTNPLAELTHKRRLSALGPGGLSRDRASFEVRDVHYTHYGRMCPIETPEGPNIGLISYLSTFARVNEYGFIEAPYRRVDKLTGIVTDEIHYMTGDVEDEYTVAQANEPLDEQNRFANKKVAARHRAEIFEVAATRADYMDVSPKMVVSVATAMIPFLENDDNSRALMGANMQRQAVPLMITESPIIGTGMEYKAAVDSGVVELAREGGFVERVAADEVVIRTDSGKSEVHKLVKFKRSNQGTCINQRPIVSKGERVEARQVIADGPSTSNGEISLGKNVLIGFMTWEGYNYEDAVLINERLVRDDVYTSLHIEEYSHEARDTKLGPEEITRDIPNVGEDALKDLTSDGIIRKGAEVRAGDILVGKVTPKGETELTAEERLLRAIFGEKAREVRDTSLRLPHGESGIIVDVKVYSRDNSDELPPGVNKVARIYVAQKRKISVGDKMAGRHGNKGVISRILPPEDMPFLPDGTPLDIVLNPLGVPSRMNIGQVLEVHLGIAARHLGWKVMTPVFDGANEQDIEDALIQAGLSGDGKTVLYDGRTGRPFDNRVTVGIMYFLKLLHLVDDKIHARSTGPYSLVTQQPLGGKAQFGGQRFGEMEVWALEAYGAAYTLQEILTVKSDDVVGRVKTYEAIVKGLNIPTPGVPESFKVLIKELQSLGLDMRVLGDNMKEIRLREASEEELEKNRSISMDMLGDQVFDDDSALIEGPDGEYEEIEENDDLVFENEFDNIDDDE